MLLAVPSYTFFMKFLLWFLVLLGSYVPNAYLNFKPTDSSKYKLPIFKEADFTLVQRTARLEASNSGDLYVIAGQSNAMGFGEMQKYFHKYLKASLFGNDYTWKELRDPVDSPVGQIDDVSFDNPLGSIWPLLATNIMTDQNIRVGFIPTAHNSSSILDWQRDDNFHDNPKTLYGSLVHRTKIVGGAKAVLFWQGERDAGIGTTQSNYRLRLNKFANDIKEDLGIPVVVAQIGDFGSPDYYIDGIRQAQSQSWDQGNVLAGPSLYDIYLKHDGGDGIHFKETKDMKLAADRWWISLKHYFYNGPSNRGPQLVSTTHDVRSITLIFNQPITQSNIDPVIFTIMRRSEVLPVDSVEPEGNLGLRLNTQKELNGSETISLGSSNTAAGKVVPMNMEKTLPAEPFIEVED